MTHLRHESPRRQEGALPADRLTFSELSRRSLKSQVIIHDSSLEAPISVSCCQKVGRFDTSGAP